MNKVIVASMRRSAGKTSVIVGLARVLQKRTGYLKPFGDRLLYRKKRLWDYDSALITSILALADVPDDMSVGFDHSKLRYMYSEAGMREKLLQILSHVEKNTDLLFVESGRDMAFGASVHLDAISLTKHLDGTLLIVAHGDEGTILDDISFVKNRVNMENVPFKGIIINKVANVGDFRNTHLADITAAGIPVLGIVPHRAELTCLSVRHLAESLFARIVAGEGGLDRVVKSIFIGAMAANAALQHSSFAQEHKLIITSGDRSDMVLAALESNTTSVILTNNILPSASIISRAAELNIPLLSVPYDTYETAKRVESVEPLLTKNDTEKIKLLEQLITEHVDIGKMS